LVDLDGLTMYVSSTDAIGVVGGDTRLEFRQKGERVWARYSGGKVSRGWLAGRWVSGRLCFRYAQVEDGRIQAGSSSCEPQCSSNGSVRLIEHFTWRTRAGSGVNVFDELRPN
jgi:hypothetical protein